METEKEEPRCCECDDVDDERPLRQGDVFRWLAASDDPWQQYGLVVTADCDIAHVKHNNLLSYVPILHATDYLRSFMLPKQLRRNTEIIWNDLFTFLRQAQKKLEAFPEPITEEAASAWVRRATADEIIDELRISERREVARLRQLHELYRKCAGSSDATFAEQVACLIAVRARTVKSETKAREKVWEELRSQAGKLPGDAFFLNALHSTLMTGYVAYLRLVRELYQPHVAIRPRDLETQNVSVRRISRLRSPYLYRLTQQLADVFAAIGLPGHYEKTRDHSFATMEAHHTTTTAAAGAESSR